MKATRWTGVAALGLCGCAFMFQSPYEYTVTKAFGERVELDAGERRILDSNIRKAEWMLAYDGLGWVSTDTLRHRLGGGMDTTRLGSWVAVDSVAYYGKIKDGRFQIAYEFDFRNKERFFRENPEPDSRPEVTQLALALEKALELFREDQVRRHTKINACLRKEGQFIDVYLIPAHTEKFYVLGGGRFSRWDCETWRLVEKKNLHETAYIKVRSKKDHQLIWSSQSNAVLNEVDIFQAAQLKKSFNIQTIMTPKYIFALEGLGKEFRFDVFGTRHLEALAAKRRK